MIIPAAFDTTSNILNKGIPSHLEFSYVSGKPEKPRILEASGLYFIPQEIEKKNVELKHWEIVT
jgi:hypothetical protein